MCTVHTMHDIDEVPTWLSFPAIHSGYRIGGNVTSNLYSLFQWHNETINAWTMIWVSLWSISSFSYIKFVLNVSGINLIPFACLCISALVHMPFSVGYHLLRPISLEQCTKLRYLDNLFICIGLCFLCFSLSFFTFPFPATIAYTGTCVLIAYTISKKIDMSPNALNTSKQAGNVSLITSFCMFPLLVACVKLGLWTELVVCLSSLVLGAFVYTKRIPEIWYPYTFDYIGNSHNIMHVCILIAHVVEYIVVYKSFVQFVPKI